MKPTVSNPQPVKGTRDWDAAMLYHRQYILDTIRTFYSQAAFSPLETPALENLDTLLGQYGQEGEQLIFKILNSGNFLTSVPPEAGNDHRKWAPYLAEKGLRYDLTVPLMRYVATHYQHLPFPYRRYQIQPVWRADRPQQGRYREFYQCDADIIGSTSLLCEAELLTIAHQVLHALGIEHYRLLLNHRSLLNGLASLAGVRDRTTAFCTIMDKLDKIGPQGVLDSFIQQGFHPDQLARIDFIFEKPDPTNWLTILQERMQQNEEGLQGIQDLQRLLDKVTLLHADPIPLYVDPTLARGLAYYTGAIFEIKIPTLNLGSIGSGGRYDHFADRFGVKNITGVGLSFGIDRLYDALEALNLLPQTNYRTTQVLFTNLDPISEAQSLPLLTICRNRGIATELYPDQAPLKKQLTYANKKSIPWVVIGGEAERNAHQWQVKDMQTGSQTSHAPDRLADYLATLTPNR
jgi:histidyl-tRNA synthetase